MNATNILLWIVIPYVTLTVCLTGVLFRFNTNPYGWTSKSSEILEKRLLKWGSNLFHWGIIFVFFGHVAGLLIPISVYQAIGISTETYHVMAITVGGIAGLATFVGLIILSYRRLKVPRIRKTSSTGDLLVLLFLIIMVVSGISATSKNALAHTGFDYRTTINPWIRGILLFHPDPSLMSDVPSYFKVHILAAFGFFAALPFSRLVHIFSFPITYLWRSYVLYRKQSGKSSSKV